MENNNEIIANISNIIFDNKEKLCNKDFLDLNNQLKELYNNLNDINNDNDNDSDDDDDNDEEPFNIFDEEPAQEFSDEWWNWYKDVKFTEGCYCLLLNSRTKKLYKGTLMSICPIEKKARFALFHDWETGQRANRLVKINYNNKRSLYRFADHI